MTSEDLSGRGIEQLISLAGRRAVITGGARGIGNAIARRLAEAGASVLIGDKDGDAAAAAATGLGKEFGVSAFACELASNPIASSTPPMSTSRFGPSRSTRTPTSGDVAPVIICDTE